MQPLVSIIVPCYNQAQYMDSTLQSVLEQEYLNWECIIVNDGSPDQTEQIALKWVDKDVRFKYFKKENGGLASARNYGIQKASGEYILPLDSDDLIDRNYIKEASEILTNNQNIKLIYCNTSLFDAQNEKVSPRPYSFINLLTENLIPCTALYRKSDFEKTIGYNSNMKGGLEDWDFWLTLLSEDDIVYRIDKYYFNYRIKDGSMLRSISKDRNEQLILQIFKNHQEKYLKYFNPIRDHIEADFYKKEVTKIKKQPEWYIGRAICAPIRLATKIWKRLFK